jgi:hypothetical protein
LRATDDLIINYRLVPKVIQSLASKHDPFRDPVLKGSCIVYKRALPFLQGGSGFLLSRALARSMLELETDFFQHCKMPEDVYLSNMLVRKANLSWRDVTSSYFVGTDFSARFFSSLMDGNTDWFPRCPSVRAMLSRGCRRFRGSLRDIVFFHSEGNMSLSYRKEIWRRLQVTPLNIVFWMRFQKPNLCRGVPFPAGGV